ncbi:hypothetical protein Vadar_002367 [Vaccinium darrowii]|uniref:Uncharacterized protein n=1 Tax=Vaccinium darrowii TaxID=229202 RepID=A0ACB7XMQ6_9ERIC|nr:hypothetical protein Vadar_002367 [Vaccinium darrowii]
MRPSFNMYLHVLLFLSWLLLPQPTLGITTTPNYTANAANITNSTFFIARNGSCSLTCGNLTVPYPFGIGVGSGCSIDPEFDINCNTSSDTPKAFIRSGNIEILSISQTQVRIGNTVASACYDGETGAVTESDLEAWIQLGASLPYTFSHEANKFTVVGCDDYAWIFGTFGRKRLSSGCMSQCKNKTDVGDETGYCQTDIPKGLTKNNHHHHQQKTISTDPDLVDYRAVADVAVNKFKKFISLLDRSRTGHTRFRRGPMNQPQKTVEPKETVRSASTNRTPEDKPVPPRVYCPTPVQRLPPLPHNHHNYVMKTGSVNERKEPVGPTTINFAAAAAAVATPTMSTGNSFKSSLTGNSFKSSLTGNSFKSSLEDSTDPPKAFINTGNIEVLSILQNQVRILNVVVTACYNKTGAVYKSSPTSTKFGDLGPSAYTFLDVANKFTVVGCDDYAWISGTFGNKTLYNGYSGYGGYLCSCNKGYKGNPYLSPGCTDINECEDPNLNDCVNGTGYCINTPGSFQCYCNHHYDGDGKSDGLGCSPKASPFPVIKFSLGT